MAKMQLHAMLRGLTALALSLAATIVVACTDQSTEAGGRGIEPVSRDSAGVQIIEVPGELLSALPIWTLAPDPNLSIGEESGEAPYLFDRIHAARTLASGEIMITDISLELRLFGANGGFLRSIGRRGSGPGEFRGFPLLMSEVEGSRIAVLDEVSQLISAVDLTSGEITSRAHDSQCRMPNDTTSYRCAPARLLSDGTVIVTRTLPAVRRPRNPQLTIVPPAPSLYGMLSGDTLRVIETIDNPAFIRGGFAETFFSIVAPFETGGQVAVGASRLVAGDPRTYELRVRNADGSLRLIVRVRSDPAPVTSDMFADARRWADTARTAPPLLREYLATVQPEGTVPFFGTLRVDRADRIWVADYALPSWMRTDTVLGWTIFDADGTPLARLPGRMPGTLLELGDDYVLTARTDSLGVQRVERRAIQRPGG